jgi:hypothetical protein
MTGSNGCGKECRISLCMMVSRSDQLDRVMCSPCFQKQPEHGTVKHDVFMQATGISGCKTFRPATFHCKRHKRRDMEMETIIQWQGAEVLRFSGVELNAATGGKP